jgi:hypothetical protein
MTAAQLEQLLAHAYVRNLKTTFEAVHPDGSAVTVEIVMPEGQLKQEHGWEPEDLPGDADLTALVLGKFVVQMKLYPVATVRKDKTMTMRVVDPD